MKFCSKCQSYKESSEFIKDKSRKDGLHIYCNNCRRLAKKINRSKESNIKQRKEYMKKYYEKNKDVLLDYGKKYQKDKTKEQKSLDSQKVMEWKRINTDKVKSYKYGTPQKRMKTHLSKVFSKKINKNRLGTCQIMENYLGYSIQDLYKHLESQFEDRMNWDNYGSGSGKWCIDHRIPDSWFEYSSYEDYDFKKCWALENLKPMWFDKNSSKKNQYKD